MSGVYKLPRAIYYTPHQDDEGLWMNLAMANDVLAGIDVHVVLLTDGTTSGVYELLTGTGGVCPIHSVTHGFTMTRPQFGGYRDVEFQANAAALGVTSHFAASRPASDALTSGFVEGVIATYAALYPGSVHHTMSWVDSLHADHRAAGDGLQAAADAGHLADALHAVFHIRSEDMAGNDGTAVTAAAGADTLADAGLTEYTVYNTGSNRYAIAYHSVKSLIDSELAATTEKIHTLSQNR